MKHLKSTFNYSGVYLTVVPTYIGGYMALTWSSDKIDISKKVNLNNHSKVINKLNTQYYTKEIHYTSFVLPQDKGNLNIILFNKIFFFNL